MRSKYKKNFNAGAMFSLAMYTNTYMCTNIHIYAYIHIRMTSVKSLQITQFPSALIKGK